MSDYAQGFIAGVLLTVMACLVGWKISLNDNIIIPKDMQHKLITQN